jgi:hypothetical protein
VGAATNSRPLKVRVRAHARGRCNELTSGTRVRAATNSRRFGGHSLGHFMKEQLLHQFFTHANLQIEVVLGRRVVPKEWFVVPLDIVEEAVKRILDRSIVNYRYDPISRKILLR